MPTSSSLYQIGGLGLIGGAVLLAVGVFVHPLPEAAAAGGSEVAAHWLYVVGLVLVLTGVISLSRHFTGHAEGMGILALALVIVGYAMLVASWGIEAAALAATGEGAALGQGAATIVEMGRVLAWISLVPVGLGMLRDTAWPRALAMSGIVVGALLAIGEFAIAEYSILRIAFLVGFAWLAVVGWKFMAMAMPSPSAASQPSAPAATASPGAPAGGTPF